MLQWPDCQEKSHKHKKIKNTCWLVMKTSSDLVKCHDSRQSKKYFPKNIFRCTASDGRVVRCTTLTTVGATIVVSRD